MSSVFANQSEGQQPAAPTSTHHHYEPNQYQHMNQQTPHINQQTPHINQQTPHINQQTPQHIGPSSQHVGQPQQHMNPQTPHMSQQQQHMNPQQQHLNQQPQHMNQQPGYPMRNAAMNSTMPMPAPHSTSQPSHQPLLQTSQQSQPTLPPSSAIAGNPSASGAVGVSQPSVQSQMAPPGSVQKMLDENNQFIQLLLDYQSKGKHQECAEYQRLLHRNLVYLATVADSNNQNIQGPSAPPNLPLPPNVPSNSTTSMIPQ